MKYKFFYGLFNSSNTTLENLTLYYIILCLFFLRTIWGFSITSAILNRGHITAFFRSIHLYYYTSTLKLQYSMYN